MEATAKNMFQYYINNFEPFLLAIMFVRKKDWLLKIVGFMILSISVNLYCIYQWLLAEGNLKRVEGFFRIMSTAGLLSMTVPVLVLLLLQSREKSRYICTALLIIAFLGAVCNNTRGAWVAIAVTIAITSMLIAKSKLKGLAVLLVLTVVISFAVYQIPSLHQRVESISNVTTDQSNAERFLLWESARNMAEDYPLTGVGSGNFGDLYHEKYILPQAKETYLGHAHNLFSKSLQNMVILAE